MNNKEQKILFTGIVFALLLSIFAQIFVATFFTMIQFSQKTFFQDPKNLLVSSAILIALLMHWFMKKIR